MTKRVAHGGSAGWARANTPAAFDAALTIGVDMIEFDVVRARGALVLAHTRVEARCRRCCTLERALAHLASPPFAAIELNVDVKTPGYEAQVVAALREHGLLGRCLISSQHALALDHVRALDPDVRLGLSIGQRHARRARHWREPTWRMLVLEALASGRFQALMAHHPLIDADFAAQVRAAGAELYAWTVDDRFAIRRLCALGVAGVTTNDLRLFSAG
jgi:glycerophosphoryl diester phosphodiesterase